MPTPDADLLAVDAYERAARREGCSLIAGVDEAGRGALAGPVAAGAIILPHPCSIEGIRDSKRLTAERREELYAQLIEGAVAHAVAVASPQEIDRLNIRRATHEAMRRAIAALPTWPEYILIDGRPVDCLCLPHQCIVNGDDRCRCIAAASIIAKVERDRRMRELHEQYPEYGFAQNKGYGTPEHLAALNRHGPSPLHRRSFEPVRQLRLGLE
ncbi:MAG: ribonuclease HII [Armatimonadota bacterium]